MKDCRNAKKVKGNGEVRDCIKLTRTLYPDYWKSPREALKVKT
jgi:hypothetical protein